jgi:hypothetical protein
MKRLEKRCRCDRLEDTEYQLAAQRLRVTALEGEIAALKTNLGVVGAFIFPLVNVVLSAVISEWQPDIINLGINKKFGASLLLFELLFY